MYDYKQPSGPCIAWMIVLRALVNVHKYDQMYLICIYGSWGPFLNSTPTFKVSHPPPMTVAPTENKSYLSFKARFLNFFVIFSNLYQCDASWAQRRRWNWVLLTSRESQIGIEFNWSMQHTTNCVSARSLASISWIQDPKAVGKQRIKKILCDGKPLWYMDLRATVVYRCNT